MRCTFNKGRRTSSYTFKEGDVVRDHIKSYAKLVLLPIFVFLAVHEVLEAAFYVTQLEIQRYVYVPAMHGIFVVAVFAWLFK
uniref:Uncharacterized protein n=1 Tax=Trichuris muris TaxID=70415 RepID=A0A5S6Q2Q3_TRIMR